MTVDIGEYGTIPTREIDGFNEKLLELFPGLRENSCGLGYPGGFLEKLECGTYLAHVLEHVILEMQSQLGYRVKYGKTRTVKEPSLYYLVYEYENEVCGLECGKAAVFILNHLLTGRDMGVTGFMEYLRKVSLDSDLGPSTSAIANEAKKQGIPVTRIGSESLLRLGYGRRSRLIESTLTDVTPCISADISCNKQLTKYILNENQIPVPYGKVVYSEISAQMVARQIGLPVVVKPFNGNQGKGVHLNLNSYQEVKAAFEDASKYSNGIIIEKYVSGKDFRVLVVGNRVCAVSERIPAHVTGDGTHTVKELIEIVNQDPNRGDGHEKPLTKIRLDQTSLDIMEKNGLKPNDILEAGKIAMLRENGNMSTGGTAIDRTDEIHPDNADIAVRAADAIGIDIAGIDIVTRDISKSILDTDGVIVEVNTAPGIRMHLYPSEGTLRNVAKDIVDLLFPDDESKRFPIVSVTGTNGKTTVVRLISHILAATGKAVGMTSTSGSFIGSKCISRGDNSGPRSARALLSNKSIDAAVLETARGGIVREGLGYDLADVGVITNIANDHLGLDGIETTEDLIFVKSLVAEAVKDGGAAVLNADDESTPEVLKRVKVKPVLFGKSRKSVEKFKACTDVAVFTEGEWLMIMDGGKTVRVARIADIPITLGGKIECNVENALAAASAAYMLGVPALAIAAGLMSFTENPGRFNLFEVNGVEVMLDYGHNFAGYEQVLKTCKKLDYNRLIGVIGMPGDRMDSSIKSVGELCGAYFDFIVIKEDCDLRGRKVGEVADLLYQSVKDTGFPEENVFIDCRETDALTEALSRALPGDLIVMFYEKYEPMKKLLEEQGARRMPNLQFDFVRRKTS
ncbi:Cyanophycin synthetase [bioreactor metagenome]|uniref:Cyanophycin synthetase n=1 Tax=bioreactor metagenome TaxID=1076179 RepID=A0A644VUS2_9ZZZZ